MHLDNENPGAARTAAGANDDLVRINTRNDSDTYGSAQRLAAARIAARFGLTASVAMVVVVLAGLGGGQ